jgi:hypothetical protein
MEMQFNKILNTLWILLLISCKGNGQEKSQFQIANHKEPIQEQIDFFNKKYFEKYELIIDESNISDHPYFSYLDCQKEGYFSVHFVPKESNLRDFWKKDYYKDTDFNKYDFEKDSKRIEELINGKLLKYNIFSYAIKKELLNTKNGCTKESVFLKDDSIVDIYIYNQQIKKWELIKSEKSNILPPYHDNDYFLKLFPEIFSFDKVLKLNENRNVAYSYDFDLDQDGIKDKIILYTNDEEKGEFERINFGLPMEIKKGLPNNTFQTWCENNNIIPKNIFNCIAEGFNKIVFKGNYFTIEYYICSDYISISTYTTFKISKDKIQLHKYGQTYFDKANHDKKIPPKTWTTKDFGEVKFEDFSQKFIINLIQKEPIK